MQQILANPPQKIHIQIGYLGIYLLVADKVNQGDLLSPPSYLHFPANALLSLFRLLKMDSAVFLWEIQAPPVFN